RQSQDPPATHPSANRDAERSGIERIKAGETFTLRLTNSERVPVYLTVITISHKGKLEILYPTAEDDPRPLNSRETVVFPSGKPFVARIDDVDAARAAGGLERTMMKI